MKSIKALSALLLAGITAAQADVIYLGNTADADLSTVIDLSVTDPSVNFGGSFDSLTRTWTWFASDTYVLQELIFVRGGTLVIEPGSIVRGQPRFDGATFNPGALIIARDTKIIADGEAANPIIFTSASVSSTGAQTGSRASGATPAFWDADPLNSPRPSAVAGNWGGLIVLGNAPTNVDRDTVGVPEFVGVHTTAKTANTDDRSAVEGIPASTSAAIAGYDRFGGIASDDNSGVLRYVSIRHGGANLSANAEINGLTIGALGRGTTIENIEIWGNTDDGVEIFGGNVNLKNIAIFNAQDDGLDMDVGYHGTVQFLLVVGGANTDKLGEWDGSYQSETVNGFSTTGPVSVTLTPAAAYVVANATFIGNPAANGVFNHSLHIRDQSQVRLVNSFLVNPNTNAIEVDNRATSPLSTVQGFQRGLAFLKGVTFWRSGLSTATQFVGGGSDNAAIVTEISKAEYVNIFNVNPGFTGLPTASDGALQAGLAINPVPTAGFTAVLDDAVAGFNNALQVTFYRGAFAPNPSADLWTTGWTAANKTGVIVSKGNGSL